MFLWVSSSRKILVYRIEIPLIALFYSDRTFHRVLMDVTVIMFRELHRYRVTELVDALLTAELFGFTVVPACMLPNVAAHLHTFREGTRFFADIDFFKSRTKAENCMYRPTREINEIRRERAK